MKQNDRSMQALKKIVVFSVPLILSGLLQQLFNWVDALIVGNVVGETALAGVGATTSLYNLFVTVLVGFTSGLNVLFAQRFGEGQQEENRALLSGYAVVLTAVFACVAALGMAFTDTILTQMDTSPSLYGYAREYLLTVFPGIPFLALYNVYSAALRGMGNSRTPFLAVLLSSVLNAGLDCVFIVLFRWGVTGAAAATALSQAAMTVYLVLYTAAHYPALRFSPFRLRGCRSTLATGAAYGMPPAVQSSVSSVGNIFLQRFMNGFGEQTVAAITTAYRVDTVLLLPTIQLSTAIATLVAQETGAGNRENARQVFRLGTGLMTVLSLLLTALILLTGRPLLALFGLTAGTISIGVRFFRTLAVFYVVHGLNMSLKGYLEGTADLLFSGVAGICSLGVRILCSYAFAARWGNMVIAYAEAISWIFLAAVLLLRCRSRMRR